jgi:hypothetical protein
MLTDADGCSKHEYAVVPPYVFQRYCLFLLNRHYCIAP